MPNEVARALKYASKHHRGQTRKGSDVPCVAHLLAVSALVLEDGGSEREAVAALLHDVVEDTDVSRRDVRKRFGRKVARIVAACTDVDGDGTHTAKNWMKRRRRMLARLRDPEHVDVSGTGEGRRLARKRAIAHCRPPPLRARGVGQLPRRARSTSSGTLRSVAVIVSVRFPGHLADELRVAVHELERVSGWWFDVGDPQAGTSTARSSERAAGGVSPQASAAALNAARCSSVGGVGRVPSAGRCGGVTP